MANMEDKMKTKSKWKGAVLVALALVMVLSLAVIAVPRGQDAEALDLSWGVHEGIDPTGLPQGAGALIDVAVVPGTSTVYVLCDQGLAPGNVVVYRSDTGGSSWGTPVNLGLVGSSSPTTAALAGTAEVGVQLAVSPNYGQDGTVFVLTNDTAGPGGYVYTSLNKGVTWDPPQIIPAAQVPASPATIAVDPNFNSLLSGGTIAVGGLWDGTNCVWYETWQSPVVGWTATWTGVPSNPIDSPDCLALMYAPTSSLRLISVQYDWWSNGMYGVTGSLTTGFPQLTPGNLPTPGNSDGADWIHAGNAATAVIGIGSDYDPVSSAACANCPMYMFVGTSGAAASSTFWFDPVTAQFADLKLASTLPAAHMATSGLVAQGMYGRAKLLTGCADVPLTYTVDVRTSVWSTPVYIEGDGGPIGTQSTNVGVKLGYGGSGNEVYAITTQVPASYYAGILPPTVAINPTAQPGDLTCLSMTDNFGTSWSDTALTQEDFRQNVVDMAWLDAYSGIVVCDTTGAPGGFQSVFKGGPGAWKRVDRWQGIQRIAVSADGAAIFLLDTGTTGAKVLRSLDGGDSFTATASDPTAIVTIMMTTIAAGSANDIFVGDWNGHIYSTHDGGATWTDAGQVAGTIKSLDVPTFYAVAKHVLAGVDTLVSPNQGVIVSKDDGATWSAAGIAMWGGGGLGNAGHVEVKFSPMYNGTTEAYAYAGINGTFADNMFRLDLNAGGMWTNMLLPAGADTEVVNFDVVKVPGIVGDTASKENIMYVLEEGTDNIYATYYPELVSETVPLWRFDLGGVLSSTGSVWALNGPTPGNTNIPCPFDAVVGASVTLVARDPAPAPDFVRSLTETTAFLTPIVMNSPANGATVASNNQAAGEPVELQWPGVPGAWLYQVMVVTDINNPATAIVLAQTAIPQVTEYTINVGSLVDGQSYYWRTRVLQSGPVNAGHTGPWSGWHSFSVEYGPGEVNTGPELLSPAPGATGVALKPGFSWKAIPNASSYDFQLATDGAFTDILADEPGLAGSQTSYGYTGTLERETTYFWRVKAMGGTGIDAWSTQWASAAFSTMAKEQPQPTFPPPVTVQEGDTVIIEQVDRDTPGWVWALIVIGAVLAIVVIVLIMRTRRLV
jgi:hypothetical protein